jgi:hypothetical protein
MRHAWALIWSFSTMRSELMRINVRSYLGGAEIRKDAMKKNNVLFTLRLCEPQRLCDSNLLNED